MPKRMTFKDKIKTRSGKCHDEELIYVTTKDGKGRPAHVHGRRITNVRLDERHETFGERMRTIADLWKRLPRTFHNDMNRYARLNNVQNRGRLSQISGYAVFSGVMWGRAPIYSLMSLSQTLGNTVDEWMENGVLRNVTTDTRFTANII